MAAEGEAQWLVAVLCEGPLKDLVHEDAHRRRVAAAVQHALRLSPRVSADRAFVLLGNALVAPRHAAPPQVPRVLLPALATLLSSRRSVPRMALSTPTHAGLLPAPRSNVHMLPHSPSVFFAWPPASLRLTEEHAVRCREAKRCEQGACPTLERVLGAVEGPGPAATVVVHLHRLQVCGVRQLRGESLGVLLMHRLPECTEVRLFAQGHGVDAEPSGVLHASHGAQAVTARELNELWLYHKTLHRIARGMLFSTVPESNDRDAGFYVVVPLCEAGAVAEDSRGKFFPRRQTPHHTCGTAARRDARCGGGIAFGAARALLHTLSHLGPIGPGSHRVEPPCMALLQASKLCAITGLTDFTFGDVVGRRGAATQGAPAQRGGEGDQSEHGQQRVGCPHHHHHDDDDHHHHTPQQQPKASAAAAWCPLPSPPCLECASVDMVWWGGKEFVDFNRDGEPFGEVTSSRLFVGHEFQCGANHTCHAMSPCALAGPGATVLFPESHAVLVAVAPSTVLLMSMVPSVMWQMEHRATCLELCLRLRVEGIHLRPDLMATALTAGGAQLGTDYERLEFLGDAVLRLLLTVYGFAALPGTGEQVQERLMFWQRNETLRSAAAHLPMAAKVLWAPVSKAASVVPGFVSPSRPAGCGGVGASGFSAGESGAWRSVPPKAFTDTLESGLAVAFLSPATRATGLHQAAALLHAWLGLGFPGGDIPLHFPTPEPACAAPFAVGLMERAFGYKFQRPALLRAALDWTPREGGEEGAGEVVGGKGHGVPKPSFSRLAMLGEATVGALITTDLFLSCPDLSEQQLTDMRQSLLRNAYLGTCLARRMWGDEGRQSPASRVLLSQCVVVPPEQQRALRGLEVGWSRWWEFRRFYDGDAEADTPEAYHSAYKAVVGAMLVDCAWDLDAMWRLLASDLRASTALGEALGTVLAATAVATAAPEAQAATPDGKQQAMKAASNVFKSSISLLYELAQKHKFKVEISIEQADGGGPGNAPWFRAACAARGQVFEGFGGSKSVAKLNACTQAVGTLGQELSP